MVDAAADAVSADCWIEGLQPGNSAQFEEVHSDCEDASSSPPLQTGPSSSAAALSILIKENRHGT